MVTVYSRPACVQCNATYKKLDQLGVPYEVVNLEGNVTLTEKFKDMGFMQAPVIRGPFGEYFSGYQPDRLQEIARELQQPLELEQ